MSYEKENALGFAELRAEGKGSRAKALGIAGEHPAVDAPPDRVRDRISTHVPAVAVPADVHRAEHAVGVTDIEDVGPPIGEQNPFLAVRLARYERVHLAERGLGLVAELLEDRGVKRRLHELRVANLRLLHRLLGLAAEPLLEVVAEEEDLDRSIRSDIDHDLLSRHERFGSRRYRDRADNCK